MKKESRFAHCEGITDITFTANGEKIITAGGDGDIRVWNNFEDDDPISFSANDSCLGVVFAQDQVIVGTESNSVEAYEFPKGKFIENKLKFTGAANHVDISKDGKVLVAGSADTTLQIVAMDKSTPPVKVDAHSAPVLSVAVDPLKEFIVSSGCDGHVCIWSFDNPNQLVKKWTQVFPTSNDITTSPTLCRMAWHPLLGKQLAVPEKDKIKLYRRETWEEAQSLSSSKLTKFFSVVCFSNCGSYVGGGGTDGTVAVWDAFTYTLKAHIKEMNHITGMAFAPITNQLLCTDSNGRLLIIKEYTEAGADEGESQTQAEVDNSNDRNTEDNVFADGMDDLFDDDGENAFSISKIKADVGFVGDEYVGPSKAKKVLNNGPDADDNDDARSVSSMASSKLSRPAAPVPTFNPFTLPQKPFQPSSTPEHLDHRFMVWNNVGIIRSYSTEDEEFNEDAIDIEFHDATFHHAIHLRNQFDYTLGNMSTEVVALGCSKTTENNSKLLCLNFSSWDSSKEWLIDFPHGEEVTGIALGTGWVAAATTENRLRLFSVSGIQKFVYDFAGTIIAITGYENLLFVTYHNGVGIDGNQNIFYAVLKLTGNCSKLTTLITDAALPLTRHSTLSWIGFSDEGTPVFSDSKEVLKILNGRLWSPFCSMKDHLTGASDHFWVVGVSETSLHVRAVKCKGAKYPPTLPRPIIMMLESKIPLCEMDTEKSQLEDVMLQNLLLISTTKRMERKGFDVEESRDEADGKTKETLFKLFAMSCTHNRDLRASEYVAMMPAAHAMQLAMKYSSKLHRVALTDRLQVIGRRKLNNEEDENNDEFDDFEFTQVVTHTEHRHLHSDTEFGSSSTNGGIASLPKSIQPDVIVLQDNPLMKKQKEEIRSLINSSFRNPFRKEKDSPGTSLTRTSSFTASLNKSNSLVDEDSQAGVEILNTSASKGMSKIDVWRKPTEKQATLPEFNPKDPNRKSLTSGNKKKNVFEKKNNAKDGGKEAPKKQRTVFDMLGKKSNIVSKNETRSPINSNPASPMPASDSLSTTEDSVNLSKVNHADKDDKEQDSERPFKIITDKKRKRQEDVINGDADKKSRISDDSQDE
ncbi:unnamed protein product [Allacma fusca]|uniref:Minichromosome loss protein Mcl1 middle region domain-containing protein n=1 Tax=Allacma fusca TaxID=39272 RepID=A0A8J2PDQ1_9HEXA|nr:unnamed protein product [Allacma fusca]